MFFLLNEKWNECKWKLCIRICILFLFTNFWNFYTTYKVSPSQISQIYTTPSVFFHIYTIHRCIKSRKILEISGQNIYGNYFFYVSGDCNFHLFGFLKIPCSDIEFSFKLQNFEKYPPKLPNNTYVYRFYSRILRIMLKTLKNTGILLLMTPGLAIYRK